MCLGVGALRWSIPAPGNQSHVAGQRLAIGEALRIAKRKTSVANAVTGPILGLVQQLSLRVPALLRLLGDLRGQFLYSLSSSDTAPAADPC